MTAGSLIAYDDIAGGYILNRNQKGKDRKLQEKGRKIFYKYY